MEVLSMKFIHIADLHLGKYVHGYSMIDNQDQVYWIDEFLKLVEEEKVDAVLMAGDIYDRSIAPKEAIKLFDYFVTSLVKLNVEVCIIAGNHDSGARLASMSSILKEHKVHIVGDVTKEVEKVVFEDAYGKVNVYLVPYLFPVAVEQVIGGKYKDYNEAMKSLLDVQDIDYSMRNVMVSHQLVTVMGNEPEKGGSEEMVGGVGGIDVSVYEPFDYVALGHIHASQKVKYDHIRYAGSNLCYHFDELKKPKKGPLVVEIKEKGNIDIQQREIQPLHSLRQVEGTLDEIIENEKNITAGNQYIHVVLKDEYVPVGASNKLEALFSSKNSILMDTAHAPSRIVNHGVTSHEHIEELSIHDAFMEFYKEKNAGEYPDDVDSKIIEFICTQIESSEDGKIDEMSTDQLVKFVMEMGEE